MTSVVSKFVIKTLCDHQGSLDFKCLEEKIAHSFTVADTVLRTVLFDDGKIAIQEGRQKVVGSQIVSPDSLIVAKTSLRLCQRKPGECPQCDGLHLCRYYVCGDCTFGLKCKNPHSLVSPHNAELLKRYGLHDLTEKQLFQLLLQNDPYLLPDICPHYNKGIGLHGSCKFTTTCTKLHVCQHYLQGDCKFGASCKRTHSVETHGMKNLRGISQENIKNLLEIYRNKFIVMGQQARPATAVPALPEVRTPPNKPSHDNPGSPTSSACPCKPMSDAERNEICLFFIRRHCSFKDKCVRVHWHLPYRWQVLDSDGETWKDLQNMEDIEKTYCDPNNDTSRMDSPSSTLGIFRLLSLQSSPSPVVQSVDFRTMKYGGSPVRRLSTASSVSKPPHFILTTQWGDGTASVTSQTLENVYLADRDTEIPFGAGKQQYILHFKGEPGTEQMYQQNVKYNTKREVRRRPLFVSTLDMEVKLKSASSNSSSSPTAECFPSHWDKTALPDFGYKLVRLSKSAKEYVMIEQLFKRTMPQEQMKTRIGGKAVNEQYLFHGTDESLIEAICEQNFDWRMCGVHGTAYGKGSYFARDASYSDRYASVKRTLNKIMFAALVLVGEYTRGSSSYVRPPAKGKGTTLYDSCVDNESNPSIYVVFEKLQIYPEYLIKYS
ncbi:hypothetical protein FQN60_014552 [Etheostoma spectabile]|uniref:Poly [ADP-ribose] polymerase n=1 Tax=Etheostoma spectabile TaxID=54343 RepID=A0A5J5D7D0_9PERO|nr:hypothetical protein FQN60_014552 [Etheostoma spectabile]